MGDRSGPSDARLRPVWDGGDLDSGYPQTRMSAEAPSDAGLVQVVRRHFHFYVVADGEPHPAFAHLAANGRQDHMLVWQLDAEHGAGEDDGDDAFDFDVLFFFLYHSVFL